MAYRITALALAVISMTSAQEFQEITNPENEPLPPTPAAVTTSVITEAPALFGSFENVLDLTTSFATTTTTFTTGNCTTGICADYMNSCTIRFGGCYPNCPGYTTPKYLDPGCDPTYSWTIVTSTKTTSSTTSTKSKSLVTTRTNACAWACDNHIDPCGQTYGAGCYSSCPGTATPSYTTPYCSATAAQTTSVPIMTPPSTS